MRRFLGIEQARRIIARPLSGQRSAAPVVTVRERACSSAAMIQAAAALLPYQPTCLDRSLVLWRTLRARGIDGELVIGVRPGRSGSTVNAHAWVEHAGVVLNDNPDVRKLYAAFPAVV